jgi:methionyl-tRNA formyltransferase
LSATVAIEPDDVAGQLHDRMAAAGAPVLVEAVKQLENGIAIETPQASENITYAEKILPAESKIDWARPAREIDLKIRGLSPFPGAWFHLSTDKGPVRIKALNSILSQGRGAPGEVLDDRLLIACGEGAIRLLEVQREGKGAMSAEDFLRGQKLAAGGHVT